MEQKTPLTPHFSLEEMTHSSALADYNKKFNKNYENKPSSLNLRNLEHLCVNYLEPLRASYGGPVKINSGFRTQKVNEIVGGAANSYHCRGLAADIHCSSWNQAFAFLSFFVQRWLKEGVGFNELILSRRTSTGGIWLHLAAADPDRKDALLKCSVISYK